jgi:hypothetical protein
MILNRFGLAADIVEGCSKRPRRVMFEFAMDRRSPHSAKVTRTGGNPAHGIQKQKLLEGERLRKNQTA